MTTRQIKGVLKSLKAEGYGMLEAVNELLSDMPTLSPEYVLGIAKTIRNWN